MIVATERINKVVGRGHVSKLSLEQTTWVSQWGGRAKNKYVHNLWHTNTHSEDVMCLRYWRFLLMTNVRRVQTRSNIVAI